MLFLYLRIVPDLGKFLKPVKELFSLVYLPCPLADHVQVVQEEVAGLINAPDDEVVLAFLEEPFGLALVKKETALFDFIQFHNVA